MTGAELINAIGIPSVIAALIYIGAKLNTLDTLKNELNSNIKPDLKDVRERLATFEGKSAGIYMAQSPISLTGVGQTYLDESGLQKYIDDNKKVLLDQCDHTNTMQTPYDVQEVAFSFFDKHEFPKKVDDALKTYAFNHGVSMDIIRRIAGIYFRDICLREHNFDSAELDKGV
jgi:hypothetical protein